MSNDSHNDANVAGDDFEVEKLFEQGNVKPAFIVGLELHLDVHFKGKQIRCRTVVHGWYYDEYFIIEAPAINGQEIYVNNNDNITVRFILNGVVYGFNTNLLRKVLAPTRLWLMAYPNILETRTLRRYTRLQSLIPVKIKEGQMEAIIIDLSLGGAMLDCTGCTGIPTEEQLTLSFILPNGNDVSDLKADIKSIKSNSQGRTIGLEFLHASPDKIQLIDDFIKKLPIRSRFNFENGK